MLLGSVSSPNNTRVKKLKWTPLRSRVAHTRTRVGVNVRVSFREMRIAQNRQ